MKKIMILIAIMMPIIIISICSSLNCKQDLKSKHIFFKDQCLKKQKPSIYRQHNLRLLSEAGNSRASQNQNSQNNEQKKYIFGWDKNQLILAIGLFIVIILVIVIIVSSILITLHILKHNRNRGKKQKDNINFDILCPEISYVSFLINVCQPLQAECCICLDQFSANNLKDQQQSINIIQNQKRREQENNYLKLSQSTLSQQKFTEKNKTIQENKANYVLLTYCGHMTHSHCFIKWLQKQHNCPMCRESFTFQNIRTWEDKMNIYYKKSYKDFFEKRIEIQRQQQERINGINSKINNANEFLKNYFRQILQQLTKRGIQSSIRNSSKYYHWRLHVRKYTIKICNMYLQSNNEIPQKIQLKKQRLRVSKSIERLADAYS